jgi:2-C-methyl-D-erythritol 4-phosphate cytidylyltransferase
MSELRSVLARYPRADRFVYFGNALVTELPDEVEEPGVMAVRGVRPTDTCKEVIDGVVVRTVPRERLIALAGPWACSRETLQLALDRVAHDATRITSPFELCRAAGLRIRVFAS